MGGGMRRACVHLLFEMRESICICFPSPPPSIATYKGTFFCSVHPNEKNRAIDHLMGFLTETFTESLILAQGECWRYG